MCPDTLLGIGSRRRDAGGKETMTMSQTTVTVPANPDLDDCLAGAAEAYIAEHPELEGWDLDPRWSDETRESVTLTVPVSP